MDVDTPGPVQGGSGRVGSQGIGPVFGTHSGRHGPLRGVLEGCSFRPPYRGIYGDLKKYPPTNRKNCHFEGIVPVIWHHENPDKLNDFKYLQRF